MSYQFVTVGPRTFTELLNPPFRCFFALKSTGHQDRRSRKLTLYSHDQVVGTVIFRWRNASTHELNGKTYQKALGMLDDLMVTSQHSDSEITLMIREAMEQAAWQFYIYEPTNLASYEPKKFDAWIRHKLRS